MSFFLSSNESDFSLKALKQGLRIDGRNLIDNRVILVKFGKNPGELEFSLGQTIILTKITCEIVPPKEERPSEGILRFKVDLSVLNEDRQNRVFSPKEYSNEISKLLERVLKGSK
jgi:exosome complex component RRP45